MAEGNSREGSPFISHGRGGAANISRDDAPYTDAGIVREGQSKATATSIASGGAGPAGTAGDPMAQDGGGSGNYSTGRGGSGNMGAGAGAGADQEYVPEPSVRQAPQVFHTGRGGEGNQVQDGPSEEGDGASAKPPHVHEGAAQRLKEKIFGIQGKP